MSETRNVLKLLIETTHKILSTAIEKLEDNLAREQVLPWLGIDGAVSFSLPPAAHTSMENIGQFILLDDTQVTLEAFAGIADDLVVVYNGLDDYLQLAAGGLETEDLANALDIFIEWSIFQTAHGKKSVVYDILKVIALMAELPVGYSSAGTLGLIGKSILFIGRVIGSSFQNNKDWAKESTKEWSELPNKDWDNTWNALSPIEKEKLSNQQIKLFSDAIYFLMVAALFKIPSLSNGIKATYGFDPPTASTTIGDQISERTLTLGLFYKLLDDDDGEIEINYLISMALRAQQHGGFGLELALAGSGELNLDLGKGWKLFTSMEGVPGVDARLSFRLEKENAGWVWGESEGTRLVLGKTALTATASVADKDLDVNISLKDCAMVFARNGSDSFLQSLIPAKGVEAGFDFGIGYSIKKGLYVDGGSGFSVFVPLHSEIGPVTVDAFYLKGSKPADGGFTLETSVGFTGKLIGITASVQQIGLLHHFSMPDGDRNLHFVDYSVSIKPPQLIGLSIDTDALKGGGFIYLDPEKGEYSGAIELIFKGTIGFKAIVIVTTKLPDGSPGYSLLILFTAEDFQAAQLGMGFRLTGIGGLLGLNRTANLEVLRQGIKTNALKSILFPANVVANAARIISDLRQVFPATSDSNLVICPVVQVAWGTDSLTTLEMGLLIDSSLAGFAIFGIVKALFPDKNAPVLQLQINFVGVLDLNEGLLTFNASLYDSRLLTLTLQGDFGVYISWGENPNLLLSAGGFHPSFNQGELPASMQNMQRLTISLLAGANPRATLQCYFAITSNSVQFGAKAELYASSAGFNVYGYVAFDVIFHSLGSFEAGFEAGLALRRNTNVLMGISVKGILAGTEPWDLRGSGSVSFFFFSISVPFHATWGGLREIAEALLEDLTALLTQEVNNDNNWTAAVPANKNLHVSVGSLEAAGGAPVIHPFGVLTFRQSVLPLNTTIQKFGSKLPKDVNRFEIKAGDENLQGEITKDQFAAGNFMELTDSEKLSRPSFEQMNSGFRMTGSNMLLSPMVINKSVTYEFSYLGRKAGGRRVIHGYQYEKSTFRRGTKGNSIARSPLSYTHNRVSVSAPLSVWVESDHFAIANKNDLRLYKTELVAASFAEAKEMYNELVRKQPALQDDLQIVSGYELNLNQL